MGHHFDLFLLKILRNPRCVRRGIAIMQFKNDSLTFWTFTWNVDLNKVCEITLVVFDGHYVTRKYKLTVDHAVVEKKT